MFLSSFNFASRNKILPGQDNNYVGLIASKTVWVGGEKPAKSITTLFEEKKQVLAGEIMKILSKGISPYVDDI